MAVKHLKPTSAGRRWQTISDFSEITCTKPEKSLLEPLPKKAGRNNNGRITTRHQGGGVGVPQAGCVLHCFGEDRATMERFVELGCYIAYGGAATFKRNDDVREAFAATPLDRILFETDCPYMAPEPIRGLECEPAMISITANALVNDRVDRTGEDAETIAQAAWENACKLFQK